MEFMNEHTRESLGFDFIMKSLEPITPYGVSKKNELRPFNIGEEALLKREYDKVEAIIQGYKGHDKEFLEIESAMRCVKEIRGSLKRSQEGAVLDEVEFFEIKNFTISIRELLVFQEKAGGVPEELKLTGNAEIEVLLDPEGQGNRTFYIYDSYSEELARIRGDRRILQGRLESERRRILREIEELLGSKPKLSGEINILKSDIEKLERARKCPYLSEGVATVLSVSFRLARIGELMELEEKIDELKLLEEREEYGIRRRLSEEIKLRAPEIMEEAQRLGNFDLILAKARQALSIGGTRPVLHNEAIIWVKEGRHIRLQEVLKKRGKAFTPVSFTVNKGVTVITGANMGGKTVNLKVLGMLSAMAQLGLFVPAAEFKTCLFDYIYFSIGDMQSIDSGLSTFGSEILGMVDIIHKSSKRGLILIDELARGTNPREGYAISRAIVRYLKNSEAITLFTTHFDGITHEEGIQHLQVRGLKGVEISTLPRENKGDSSQISQLLECMDYTLERVEGGEKVPEDAINIARLMGLDNRILEWAEKILRAEREE